MSSNTTEKLSKFESPIWLWARIRALRNYRAEITHLESCLFELKQRIELEKRQRKASNLSGITIERERA